MNAELTQCSSQEFCCRASATPARSCRALRSAACGRTECIRCCRVTVTEQVSSLVLISGTQKDARGYQLHSRAAATCQCRPIRRCDGSLCEWLAGFCCVLWSKMKRSAGMKECSFLNKKVEELRHVIRLCTYALVFFRFRNFVQVRGVCWSPVM